MQTLTSARSLCFVNLAVQFILFLLAIRNVGLTSLIVAIRKTNGESLVYWARARLKSENGGLRRARNSAWILEGVEKSQFCQDKLQSCGGRYKRFTHLYYCTKELFSLNSGVRVLFCELPLQEEFAEIDTKMQLPAGWEHLRAAGSKMKRS
jgi:hypothetical protein